MAKLGKAAKDLFVRTDAGGGKDARPGGGDVKVTVILPQAQVLYLDRLAMELRGETGMPVRRTEILRGVVGVLTGRGLTDAERKAIRAEKRR